MNQRIRPLTRKTGRNTAPSGLMGIHYQIAYWVQSRDTPITRKVLLLEFQITQNTASIVIATMLYYGMIEEAGTVREGKRGVESQAYRFKPSCLPKRS